MCPACGDEHQLDNVNQLRAKTGPRFVYWRRRVAASVGAELAER
jgi:hypothetical protein